MNKYFYSILLLIAYGTNIEAQSLQITTADTLVQGHVSQSTQVGANVTVKNVSNSAKDFLVKRIDKNYNSLTDSNAFCWGPICYQPNISVAPMAQNIAPGEEFKGFIGYVYPDAGGSPTKGTIRYVFYDANNPNDSVSHTIAYETTANFSVSEAALPDFKLFPNPTSGITTLSFDGEGEANFKFEIINLVGQVFFQEIIVQDEFTFNAADFPPGLYVYRVSRNDKTLISRKLVVK